MTPALADPRTRAWVRRRTAWTVVLLLLAADVLVSGVLLVRARQRAQDEVLRTGTRVTGTVDGRTGCGRSGGCGSRVIYTVDGERLRVDALGQDVPAGADVEVAYDPHDPGSAVVPGRVVEAGQGYVLVGIVAGVGLVLLLLRAGTLLRVRRRVGRHPWVSVEVQHVRARFSRNLVVLPDGPVCLPAASSRGGPRVRTEQLVSGTGRVVVLADRDGRPWSSARRPRTSRQAARWARAVAGAPAEVPPRRHRSRR